jgi:hypothetical protein
MKSVVRNFQIIQLFVYSKCLYRNFLNLCWPTDQHNAVDIFFKTKQSKHRFHCVTLNSGTGDVTWHMIWNQTAFYNTQSTPGIKNKLTNYNRGIRHKTFALTPHQDRVCNTTSHWESETPSFDLTWSMLKLSTLLHSVSRLKIVNLHLHAPICLHTLVRMNGDKVEFIF